MENYMKDQAQRPQYRVRKSRLLALKLGLILPMIVAAIVFAITLVLTLGGTLDPTAQIIVTILAVISCLFTVGLLLVQIYLIEEAHVHICEFYENRVVEKRGVFSIQEKQKVFLGVYTVTVRQSLAGRIFNFGDVIVDSPGDWDAKQTFGISNPHGLKRYLEKRIKPKDISTIIVD